jgi:primosomal protein N' (replication factor Y) (superfamily II helicase)
MRYYEVLIGDSRYKSGAPLIYKSDDLLDNLSIVSVPLRNRLATGYVRGQADKPPFAVKDIKARLSQKALPFHCLQLAEWLSQYYAISLGEALRQFGPSQAVVRRTAPVLPAPADRRLMLDLDAPLTKEQRVAIKAIEDHPSTTLLLHGETGSGKTRVYLELTQKARSEGLSTIILVPEIALTAQMALAVSKKLGQDAILLHSELSVSQRKKVWFDVLEAERPLVIVGPRSALFAPVHNLGLVIVDEAHEPAYKQEQTPRYHANRVASQLGLLTSAKVVLGSATPSVTDYYLAEEKKAVIKMGLQAVSGERFKVDQKVVDLKERQNFTKNNYLSNQLIKAIEETLAAKKQVIIYYNRRGSARIIICGNCGWQLLCPNCDIPLVYHADEHTARCHICGYSQPPPGACPDCGNPDIIYKSIGSKALVEMAQKLFPAAKIARFDSDAPAGERLEDLYQHVHRGEVDILVGTQLLAKGLDLPRLGLVGIIAAETSLSLPDFSAEERTFQLLYQIIGRVGRGHNEGRVVIQSYDPANIVIKSAIGRDWPAFYKHTLTERQAFRFPPFSYLLKLVCRRATLAGAQNAAIKLKAELVAKSLPVEIIGPTPGFYGRRGRYFFYQIVVKSKQRSYLQQLSADLPAGWSADLDPVDLL